ncbi:MAG: complex I NDUFA9 subunit family protein [Steroidobacteraceae bacterium]|nr:complex I NDUFA9 subunit family protein [Steroidobacteraceae bacterium]
MAPKALNVCVLGGTGFVGTELVTRLAEAGHSVRVPTRHVARGNHLKVLPTLELVVANVHEPRVLGSLFDGMDVVINLIGTLNEHGRATFRSVHADLAAKVVAAMRNARVPRLLHMSSLGAAPDAPSEYLRSKAEAERHVRSTEGLQATIFRPSVIFGPDDTLTNRFARLLKMSAGFLPLARPHARFAPIYLHDVAKAFVRALEDARTIGNTYELCGPDVMTLAELVRQTASAGGLPCHVIPLPDALARIQALVMGLLPGKPFTMDNFRSLTIDSVCRENGCARLGINPVSLHAVAGTWLSGRFAGRHLEAYRHKS